MSVSPTIPTTTINKTNLLNLYTLPSTLNNLPSYIPLSGSVFTNWQSTTNSFTVFIYLATGSATTLANSGSRYHIDWSADGNTWFGTGSNTGYTGSITLLNIWTGIPVTGSAPYWRVILINQTGSSISGSILAFGR